MRAWGSMWGALSPFDMLRREQVRLCLETTLVTEIIPGASYFVPTFRECRQATGTNTSRNFAPTPVMYRQPGDWASRWEVPSPRVGALPPHSWSGTGVRRCPS